LNELDSTTQLLNAHRRGDPSALRRLLARITPWLRRTIRRRLPAAARERVDTDDILQAGYAALFPHLGEFVSRRPGALRAYAWKVMVREVTNQARRVHGKGVTVRPDLDRLESPTPPVFDVMLATETGRRIREAIHLLSEREQVAVIARQVHGYSFSRVAALIGVPSADAARKVVARALARLAEQMARGEDPGPH
jgi:RNA polymerase sigma factor (sigma-70 family)